MYECVCVGGWLHVCLCVCLLEKGDEEREKDRERQEAEREVVFHRVCPLSPLSRVQYLAEILDGSDRPIQPFTSRDHLKKN